jgi:hypothetical protein
VGPEVETAVSRSQVEHIWYPGRSGYALAKALTEAGLLGGSKLNLKGTGWKTDGTSWLMDGSEVASGLACCWEATPVVVSGARTTPDMSPAGVPASSARSGPIADEVRLLPGHGCSVFSSSGEEGGGANPDVPLLPRGDVVVEFASVGRADNCRCCRATRGGVPCRSCHCGT